MTRSLFGMDVQTAGLTWLFTICLTVTSHAQPTAEDTAARQLLDQAKKFATEFDAPQAADRYRQFLQKYAARPEANAVRLALGRLLTESLQRDYQAALTVVAPLVEDKEFADRPHAWYVTGVAQRALADQLLQQAAGKPDAATQREAANKQLDAARLSFANAANGFALRTGNSMQVPAGQPVPEDLEWAYRAKCDQAEILHRLNRPQEALTAIEPLLNHPRLQNSRYRRLAAYQHGRAAFLLNDPATAFRDLAELAPFKDPTVGAHARYLLARMHDAADERPEAALHYDAVITGYEADKVQAQEQLRNPNQFRDKPEERLRLEALVRTPVPEFVTRAQLQQGLLAYADGRYGEAASRLATFAKSNPPPSAELLQDANLRLGMSQVQSKQYIEGVKTLNPLLNAKPVAAAANLWMARAYASAADPAKPTFKQDLRTAADHFLAAIKALPQPATSETAAQLTAWQLELAEAYQKGQQPVEAVAIYRDQLKATPTGPVAERLLLRLATALAVAGQTAESDAVCLQFAKNFPKSFLLSEIAYRSAQNSLDLARQAAAKDPQNPDAKRLLETAIPKLTGILANYPETPQAANIRFDLGNSFYQLGKFTECAEVLETLADAERAGELSTASYLHADAVLRTIPTDLNDAISAGRALQQMNEAIKQLNKFTAGAPTEPQMPEAILKLAGVQMEAGALLIDPQERNAMLTSARQTLDKFSQTYPTHPLKANMYLERARSKALVGDIGGAVTDLTKFQAEPYRSSPVAPLALLRLAGYHRQQNRHDEVLRTIGQCLDTYEAKSPTAEWVPAAYYLRGVALKDTNKLPEALAVFAALTKKFPNSPAAGDGLWRTAQSLREDLPRHWAAARKVLDDGNAKSADRETAEKTFRDTLAALNTAATTCEQAARATKTDNAPEGTQRQWYEAAWSKRAIAEFELQLARAEQQREQTKKIRDALVAKIPPGQPVPDLRPLEMSLSELPAPAAEQQAAAAYTALIQAAPNAPLSTDARLELAEMRFRRKQYDDALRLAQDALDNDPTPELSDKLTILIGSVLAAKQDFTAALEKFKPIAANQKSPLSPEARYRLGEVYYQQQDWQKAIEQLLPFRDQGQLQNIAHVTDKALFRLGQSQFQLAQWDQARNTLDQYVNRFGGAPGRQEARYLMARSRQELKQHDDAVNMFQQVAGQVAAEVGAKCQLGIGECRLAQKRYPEALAALTSATIWFDYAEPTAAAWLTLAQVHQEMKNDEQAVKALQTVVEKYPNTKSAATAKQRLPK